MKRLLLFLIFATLFLLLPVSAKRFTQGFRLAKMNLEFPHHPEWEIAANPEVGDILKQPFSFIGKGAQCYVFGSKDGKYVIKLFRYDQPTSSEDKILYLFNACKMAYDQLREETGLVYIHLNPTPQNLPLLRCKDPIGRTYEIPLDRYRFAIQKRGLAFRETLKLAHQNPHEMQKRIDEFLALLQSRVGKGIFNTDPNLSRNFGFLEDRAIEFDFGNYRQTPDLNQQAEMKRYTNRLRRWLKKRAPEWVAYLDQKVEALP